MGFILIAVVLWIGFDHIGSNLSRIADTLEKQDRLREEDRLKKDNLVVVSKETFDKISSMKIIRR